MTDSATQTREMQLPLPENAPQVRITAGAGSAGQKTWNLRRPITLIGSKRPAHIVMHDVGISSAHCVIVNTGSEVLVKDLRTSGGTCCNQERVNLTLLKDGDVITVGSANIQVAIKLPDNRSDDSGCGLKFSDPTKFPKPLTAKMIHTDRHWLIENAIAMVGRHQEALVRLDHPDVSSRHAVIFRFATGAAIFDLGSRGGLWVNGQRCSLAFLRDGDCITVGPFGLAIGATGSPPLGFKDGSATASQANAPRSPNRAGNDRIAAAGSGLRIAVDPASTNNGTLRPSDKTVHEEPRPLPAIEADLVSLDGDITEAWERLNVWRAQLEQNASSLSRRKADLAARAAELEAKDAALRGQLHDVQRYQEEVLARERELAKQMSRLQVEDESLADARRQVPRKEAELEKRSAELQRRENAVAQRWSRLSATRCPHCGEPVHVGQVDPGGMGTEQ